jgi:hypothetical protein
VGNKLPRFGVTSLLETSLSLFDGTDIWSSTEIERTRLSLTLYRFCLPIPEHALEPDGGGQCRGSDDDRPHLEPEVAYARAHHLLAVAGLPERGQRRCGHDVCVRGTMARSADMARSSLQSEIQAVAYLTNWQYIC